MAVLIITFLSLAWILPSRFFEEMSMVVTGILFTTYGYMLVGKKIKWIIIAAGVYIILAIPLDMILFEYETWLSIYVNLEVLFFYILGLLVGWKIRKIL